MVSLFSRTTDSTAATKRLLFTLKEFWGIKTIGEADDAVIVEMPYKCPPNHNYEWAFLNDNGGEINFGYINDPDHAHNVPTTDNTYRLTVETTAYRIAMALRGEAIDWAYNLDVTPDGSAPMILHNC